MAKKELFYFQSKNTQGKDGKFVWYRCQSESSCRNMALNGYNVKMVVIDVPDPPKAPLDVYRLDPLP